MPQKRKPVTVISADELLSLLKGNVLFIELRSDPDYRRVHLPELSIRVDPRHVVTACARLGKRAGSGASRAHL